MAPDHIGSCIACRAEVGQAAEPGLATRAVADRDNLGSGSADEGLHIGVPAWVVFTADGGQVDGQHGEPHAGLQHPGEGFEEGAVGTAGAGAVVAPLQRFMWFPSRETHQVTLVG